MLANNTRQEFTFLDLFCGDGLRVEINRRQTAEAGALQTEGEAAATTEKIEEGEILPCVVRKHGLFRSRANQLCMVTVSVGTLVPEIKMGRTYLRPFTGT